MSTIVIPHPPRGGLCSLSMMHCTVINYRIGLYVITLKMDALSKQLHQAPVLGEDTDVIYSLSISIQCQSKGMKQNKLISSRQTSSERSKNHLRCSRCI